MKSIAILAASLALLSGAANAGPGTPIRSGTYHCLAGSSRMMLTLGDMQISGMNYTFKAPTGPATAGTYTMTPKGYTWSGDIGAITHAQIVESAPDGTPGEFWFTYRGGPNSAPTSVSCSPA